jgi:hypothetical protein
MSAVSLIRYDAAKKALAAARTRLDRPPVVIVTSESAHAFKIARDFDRIADDVEGSS